MSNQLQVKIHSIKLDLNTFSYFFLTQKKLKLNGGEQK